MLQVNNKKKSHSIIIKDLFSSLIFAFIFAFLFEAFFYQPFRIPSESMNPGLQVGDYLFVQKFAYGYNNSSMPFTFNKIKLFNKSVFFSNPKRGDVIVFLLTKDNSCHYIKRLIGLPGDIIQIKEGSLYINNVVIRKKHISNLYNNIDQFDIINENNIFIETLPNGVHYKIHKKSGKLIHFQNFDHNNTPVYRVPKDHYFFMGDNRDNSIDSNSTSSI